MPGDERRVVAELFARIEQRDPAGAMALVHPEIRWGPTVWSSGGTLRGADAVRDWFAQFGPSLEHLRIEVREILGESGLIAVLGVVFDGRGGTDFSVLVGWTFAVADGRVIEGRAYTTWDEARTAAGVAQ